MDVKNPEHKRIAPKFRIGNHNLRIESGRFTLSTDTQLLILNTRDVTELLDHLF